MPRFCKKWEWDGLSAVHALGFNAGVVTSGECEERVYDNYRSSISLSYLNPHAANSLLYLLPASLSLFSFSLSLSQ